MSRNARLVTFRYDFEGDWSDVDLDDVRDAVGSGICDIYDDEPLDVSDEVDE